MPQDKHQPSGHTAFIHKEAKRILRICETRDPFRIAKELGIHVMFNDAFDKLKGMYKVIKRSRFIFINSNISELDQKTVCAHELGHDRFHRDMAKSGTLQEFRFYDMRLTSEREANIFAAEILIDTSSVLEMSDRGYDINQMAGELAADVNLLLIKLSEMERQGYKVKAPYIPASDFLKF